METVHSLIRSRFGLGRKESLCFGKVGTDEQGDTSSLIYYQAPPSPSRKALAFVIYDDYAWETSLSLILLLPPVRNHLSSGSFAKEQVKRGDVGI